MSETKGQSQNKGPRAYEIHPVPVRIVQENIPVQQPQGPTYDAVGRKMRDLQKLQLESDELDVSVEIEEKKTKMRELRARQAELDDQRRRGDSVNRRGTPDDNMEVTPEFAAKIAELPDDKRQAVMQTYSMFQAARGGESNSMLPLLLMYSQKPSTSAPDIATYGDQMLNAFQTGQASVAGSGGQSTTDTILLKLLDKQLETKPVESKNDTLATITALKDAGLIYTPADVSRMLAESGGKAHEIPLATGPNNAELEIKRLDMTQTLELKKMDNDMRLGMAKLGLEEKKSESLTKVVDRLGNTIGRAMADGEVDELEEKGATSKGLPKDTPSADIAHNTCPNCKADIVIPEPEKARTLKCVKCGTELDYTPTPASK